MVTVILMSSRCWWPAICQNITLVTFLVTLPGSQMSLTTKYRSYPPPCKLILIQLTQFQNTVQTLLFALLILQWNTVWLVFGIYTVISLSHLFRFAFWLTRLPEVVFGSTISKKVYGPAHILNYLIPIFVSVVRDAFIFRSATQSAK